MSRVLKSFDGRPNGSAACPRKRHEVTFDECHGLGTLGIFGIGMHNGAPDLLLSEPELICILGPD